MNDARTSRRDSLATLAPVPVGSGARFPYVAPELHPCEVVSLPYECFRLRRADGFWSQGFPSPLAIRWHIEHGTALRFTRPKARAAEAVRNVEAPPNAKRARPAPRSHTVSRGDVETPARLIIAAARRLDATLENGDPLRAYREFFEVFDIALADLARAVQ